MSSKNNQWKDNITHKVELLHSQIGSIQRWAETTKQNETVLRSILKPYYELLNRIYEDEFPIINAINDSDLVLRLEGPLLLGHNPRLSLVTSVFTSVRKQVTNLTKAFAGISEIERNLPRELDLGLSAVAKGSLILGFTVPPEELEEKSKQINLLGQNDPLYTATKEAIRTLGVVTKYVSKEEEYGEIEKNILDPKVRDVAMIAAKNLSPSGRTEVEQVGVISKSFETDSVNILTPNSRKFLKKFLDHPVIGFEEMNLVGIVREIDLDARRFEIRRIVNAEIEDIRCIYNADLEKNIHTILNKKIKAFGTVDRSTSGKPRLMEIKNLELEN